MKDDTNNKSDRTVRPFLKFTPAEYRSVSLSAINADMNKSDFLRACVLHCVKHNITPDKP